MSKALQPLVIVTGSSGLIGARVVADLASEYRVIGLDRNDAPPGWKGHRHIACDFTRDDSMIGALAKVRRDHGDHLAAVVHLAAYYDFSGEPSRLYQTLTVDGTRRLLRELGRFAAVEQLVFASTLLVVQPAQDADEVTTRRSPVDGEWDYPRSKIAAERVVREERGAIPSVILRIAGAYHEDGHSPPITEHIARIHQKRHESYAFPGDPTHGQPFVHLADLVTCFRKVIEQRSKLSGFEVFLVAEPDVLSYEDLQDRLGELIHGERWPTIRIPGPIAKAGAWVQEKLAAAGEEPFIRPWMVDFADAHYPASIRRIAERVGWTPAHRLHDVLPEMIRRLHTDPLAFYERNDLAIPDDLRHDGVPTSMSMPPLARRYGSSVAQAPAKR